MRSLIGAVIVGGLVYWYLQNQKAETPGAKVVNQPGGVMYSQPIGPGLTGVTNVGKMNVIDAPMGAFARW